jgi:uncharacterized membrane protein
LYLESQLSVLSQALPVSLYPVAILSVENYMKTMHSMAAGAALVFTSGVDLAQAGSMMGGGNSGFGWMGGYGGVWMPVLLIVVVVALVVLVVQRKDK